MKKALMLVACIMLVSSVAAPINFLPSKMILSAPQSIQYNFDGSTIKIPVNVSGKGGSGIFMVYTSGQAESIKKVKNGFLGWHYVNRIDTSVYLAPVSALSLGSNQISWDGRDDDGKQVPKGTYTYYLFAFDNYSAKTKVSGALYPYWGSVIVEKGTDGKPLANPFISTSKGRWTLGSDPEEMSLLETTGFTLPTGWNLYGYSLSGAGGGPVALDPADYNMVYATTYNTETLARGLVKYKWVPNGVAELQTSWADNGYALRPSKGIRGPGVVTDGKYLYTGESDHVLSTDAISSFRIFDFDGTLLKQIDLTQRWSNTDDQLRGGQINGGPWLYRAKNGFVFLNCHCSCIKELVNPAAALEGEDDFLVWSNTNGDYILDHHYEANDQKPWICNDFNVPPEVYCVDADKNMFSAFLTNYIGAVSFALLGPDGTGIGYFAYSGETGNRYDGIEAGGTIFCQNGSAYDGIYTDNFLTGDKDKAVGTWFIAHDSIRGVISYLVNVDETSPATFAVTQNTPNPFNPTTTITFSIARAGKVTVDVFNSAGQKVDTIAKAQMTAGSHTVTWNAAKFSAGVYFATVNAGSFSKTVKMTLLK